MNVSITYCGMWNYLPQASRLKAEIEKHSPKCSVVLIESGGGLFEVEKDGELIFSKKDIGRFPENQEVLDKL